MKELLYGIYGRIKDLPPVKVYESEYEDIPKEIPKAEDVTVQKYDHLYIVEGDWLLKLMRGINFDDYESLQYFQKVLKVSGIIDKLRQAGIQEGDTVSMYDFEFDFVL